MSTRERKVLIELGEKRQTKNLDYKKQKVKKNYIKFIV